MVAPFKTLALKARYLGRGSITEGAADLEAILKLPDSDPAGERWRGIMTILTEIKKIPEE